MLLRDISVADIVRGSRWLVPRAKQIDVEAFRAGDFQLQTSEVFGAEDTVAYAGVSAEDDRVRPLLLLKRVGDLDYGGDWFEMIKDIWRLVGEEPGPDYPVCEEFIADPLPEDPSFSTQDPDPEAYRRHHRDGFRRLVTRLNPQ